MEILGVTKTVVEYLREKIITGELPSNKRLSEPEIASEFQISRGPLREAFRILEEDKLIVAFPRKGAYVAEHSMEDFKNLYQAREMIEAYSVDLLKEMGSQKLPEVEHALKEIARLRMPNENSDNREKLNYLFTFVEFHTALVKSTRNSHLIHFYKKIQLNVARYQFIYSFVPGAFRDALEQHEQIYKYIQDGKWQKAKKLLVFHIRSFGQSLQKKINEYPKTTETELLKAGS